MQVVHMEAQRLKREQPTLHIASAALWPYAWTGRGGEPQITGTAAHQVKVGAPQNLCYNAAKCLVQPAEAQAAFALTRE